MKVLEESANKLKHEFKIEVPSKDIEARVEQSLMEYGKTAKIAGFRPGKIPLKVLKQRYETAARKDALNDVVKDSMTSILTKKSLHPATNPEVDISSYKTGEDLTFTLKVEVLPEIKLQDHSKISLQKLKVKLNEKDVEEHLVKLLEGQNRTSLVEKARKSKKGDTVVIDALAFDGKIETPQQNLTDLHLVLGMGRLEIFEDKLTGLLPGNTIDIDFTLPEDFPDKNFAGKTLTYKTTVKELREPLKIVLTDEIAQEFKFKDLSELKEEAKGQLEKATEEPTFLHTKRQILDELDTLYKFELPEGLVTEEFKLIWEDAKHEIEHEAEHHGAKKPSQKEMDQLEKKYRLLAERRVRLGLVLSTIGKENQIAVPKEKMTQAIIQAARQHKGQEKEAFDYYLKNAEAQARLRAPLLEDEVISFIIEHAKVKEKETTLQQFKKEIEKLSEE